MNVDKRVGGSPIVSGVVQAADAATGD